MLVKLNRDDHGDDVNSSNDQMEEDREGDTHLNVEYYVGDMRLQWHNDKVYNLNKAIIMMLKNMDRTTV